tara:strand:+ start:936 stop:1259 length:324 start_codon:yes stop_codon:yes gene_type:complete
MDNTMRDKIAEIISAGFMQHEPCASITNAILAALPSMVKPLVWDAAWGGAYESSSHVYLIKQRDNTGFHYIVGAGLFGFGAVEYETLAEAKAAANTHNRAAIMTSFE